MINNKQIHFYFVLIVYFNAICISDLDESKTLEGTGGEGVWAKGRILRTHG